MTDGPSEAAKAKAFELADEYLALNEAAYHDDRDESMAVMVLVAKFIVKSRIDPPEPFLRWLVKAVKVTLRTAVERRAAQ